MANSSAVRTAILRPAVPRAAAALFFAALAAGPLHAADVADARKLLNTGHYEKCITTCAEAIKDGEFGESWWILKVRAELATGRNADALATYTRGVDRYDSSLELRLLGIQALRNNDQPQQADELLASTRKLPDDSPWRYTDAPSLVAIGRIMLLSGIDAKQVLQNYYDKAKKDSPDAPESYVATGELALSKHDFAVAAEAYQAAVKLAPDDPEVYLGLARAFVDDDEQAATAVGKALELNPRHVGSMLLVADNLIDREEYVKADAALREAHEVNPHDPRVWALRAVLANLTGDHKKEAAYRNEALSTWRTNPEVDYMIGAKLSRDYRFAEGAAYQRKSLEFSPDYLPAKAQLCEDLLRLGKEEEAWQLSAEVFKEDPYNVLAYNFVTLHDAVAKFKTLESDHFLVRMDPKESQFYGQDVIALLERAHQKFTAKYDIQLPFKTIVEIFPEQKDFAIRTFGMPGGGDFLGVCFGPVVTISGNASRPTHPSNWQAVAWHEFCHTITLTKTRNKMPRWLSEGISVYEESQENASWGQSMNPSYREIILGGKATPVSKLSSAFMLAQTPLQLLFAYYESSMVVEYINKEFGADAIKWVLADLGADYPINEALARHTEPIEKLDIHFDAWLRARANDLAPKVNWERPPAGTDDLAAWNDAHPNSFVGLVAQGRLLLENREWKQAQVPLEKAIEIYPAYSDDDGPYPLLAAAHRQLGETAPEQKILQQFAARNQDAIDARLRLIDIATAASDWPEVEWQAKNALAINPLIAAPHRALAQSAEILGDRAAAISARRALLQLDPLNRVEDHYHLAKLLFEEQQLPAARREVDKALEDAPRYRAAHTLLLDIATKMDAPTLPAPPATSQSPASSPPATGGE